MDPKDTILIVTQEDVPNEEQQSSSSIIHLINDDEKIQVGLIANGFQESLEEYKNKYLAMSLDDVEDKAKYEVIKRAHIDTKAIITQVNKTHKAFAAPVKEYLGKLKNTADHIKGEISLVVDHLGAERQKFENHKQAQKEAEENARKELIETRTSKLFDTGFMFDGNRYSIGQVYIDSANIEVLDDPTFNQLIKKGQSEAEIARRVEAKLRAEMQAEKEAEAAKELEKSSKKDESQSPAPTASAPPPSKDTGIKWADESFKLDDMISFGNFLFTAEREKMLSPELDETKVHPEDINNWRIAQSMTNEG